MKLDRASIKNIFSSGRKQNDREVFIKAYDLYVDQIYRFIYFKVGNREDAEDLSSAVFLKSWNHIKENTLTSFKSLRPLFYKIARNCVIDHYRTNHSINNHSLSQEIEIADEENDLAGKMEKNWDLTVLETKLPELKDEYREIIILRFINDLSISEIAEILDKSKGNVRVMIYRALNALKQLVKEK